MLLALLRFIVKHVYEFVHNHKIAPHLVELLGILLALWLGYAVHRHFVPKVTVIQTDTVTKTVYVDKPIITIKEIKVVVKDPKQQKQIEALLAENESLKATVTQLNLTVAELKSHGGGIVLPNANGWTFNDWHLTATFTPPESFGYDLHQKFEVYAATGRNKNGVKMTATKLFEVGVNGERIPLTNVDATNIFTDDTKPHWFVSPRIQGGIAVTSDGNGGIVGLQWLKRGRTPATEDIAYAILTPVLFAAPGKIDYGILPVSWNIGSLRHQPFTNLWLSPFMSRTRFGLVLSATF